MRVDKVRINAKIVAEFTKGGMNMPLYVMLTKLTSDGRKSVMNNPGRIFKVHKELEEMGAKIIAQYAVLGDFNFVNIIEAESNEAIARIAAQFGSRGTIEPITMGAITMQDYVRELETAKIMSK